MNIEKDICVCLCGILLYSSSFGMFNNNNNNNNDSQNNTGITFTWKKPIFRFGQISGVSLDDLDPSKNISQSRSMTGTTFSFNIPQNLPTSQSAVGPTFFQPEQRELELSDCKYFIKDGKDGRKYGYTDLSEFIEDVYLESRIKSLGLIGQWRPYCEDKLLIYVSTGPRVTADDVKYSHLSVYVDLGSEKGRQVKLRLDSNTQHLVSGDLKGLKVSKFSYGYECNQQIVHYYSIPIKILTEIYGDDYSPSNYQVEGAL